MAINVNVICRLRKPTLFAAYRSLILQLIAFWFIVFWCLQKRDLDFTGDRNRCWQNLSCWNLVGFCMIAHGFVQNYQVTHRKEDIYWYRNSLWFFFKYRDRTWISKYCQYLDTANIDWTQLFWISEQIWTSKNTIGMPKSPYIYILYCVKNWENCNVIFLIKC